MTVAHLTLPEAALHEPKGVSTASANTHYRANGSGGGSWVKLTAAELDTDSLFTANIVYLTCSINDISTAETVYVAIPFGGTLTSVTSVLQAAITGADSLVTVKDHGGNSAGVLTVAFTGSAAGDIDELGPSVNNLFTAGQRVSLTTDGASTGTARLFITLKFTVTA